MKAIRVEKAVGMPLGHDLTEIIPGEFKGRAFSKGHIIRKEDLPRLLDIGKENVYLLKLKQDEIHEDEAALRIARALAGPGLDYTAPVEGKVNLKSLWKGLLKVKVQGLNAINSLGNLVASTMHNQTVVDQDITVAGTRAIPLVIPAHQVEEVERIGKQFRPILEIKPFKTFKAGIVVTGNEIYKGRKEDRFGPVVEAKLAAYGSTVLEKIIVPDEKKAIVRAFNHLKNQGADLLLATGGMSVDPDDKTPGAIKTLGAKIVSYGAPVLPGSMLLIAYLGSIPVMGLPGCVMHARTTALDLFLPRIHAGETIKRSDIAGLGHGGLCHGCTQCQFPHCAFGKK